MTALLALALIGVVWGFVLKGRALAEKRVAQPAPVAASAGTLASLTLAPGVRIVSVATDSGSLVLHLSGPSGDEVQIIDMATGTLIRQVKTQP